MMVEVDQIKKPARQDVGGNIYYSGAGGGRGHPTIIENDRIRV